MHTLTNSINRPVTFQVRIQGPGKINVQKFRTLPGESLEVADDIAADIKKTKLYNTLSEKGGISLTKNGGQKKKSSKKALSSLESGEDSREALVEDNA